VYTHICIYIHTNYYDEERFTSGSEPKTINLYLCTIYNIICIYAIIIIIITTKYNIRKAYALVNWSNIARPLFFVLLHWNPISTAICVCVYCIHITYSRHIITIIIIIIHAYIYTCNFDNLRGEQKICQWYVL